MMSGYTQKDSGSFFSWGNCLAGALIVVLIVSIGVIIYYQRKKSQQAPAPLPPPSLPSAPLQITYHDGAQDYLDPVTFQEWVGQDNNNNNISNNETIGLWSQKPQQPEAADDEEETAVVEVAAEPAAAQQSDAVVGMESAMWDESAANQPAMDRPLTWEEYNQVTSEDDLPSHGPQNFVEFARSVGFDPLTNSWMRDPSLLGLSEEERIKALDGIYRGYYDFLLKDKEKKALDLALRIEEYRKANMQ